MGDQRGHYSFVQHLLDDQEDSREVIDEHSESEEEEEVTSCTSRVTTINMVIVDFLKVKKNKCLLEKSQMPGMKERKKKATGELIALLEGKFATTFNEKQMGKKLLNLKQKLKEKMDLNKTGNRKIVLKKWEQDLAELCKTDINPVFNNIPMGTSSSLTTTNAATTSSTLSQLKATLKVAKPSKPPAVLEEMETDETAHLTTAELTRLVLLQQHRYYKLKEAKLLKEV